MDIMAIEKEVIHLIGTIVIGGISVWLVVLRKKISSLFVKHIWGRIMPTRHPKTLNISDIDQSRHIHDTLIEIRTLTNSDRSSVYQFHNGEMFTTQNPIWKVTNTHESVAAGVAPKIAAHQKMYVSAIIDIIASLWVDSDSNGITRISPDYCGNCMIDCTQTHRRAIFVDVEKLADSYSRSMFKTYGVKYAILVTLHNSNHVCVGFTSIDYCGDHDIEWAKSNVQNICDGTVKIEFYLDNSTNIKAPINETNEPI